MRNIREREILHGHDFDSLIPILASSSADLRNTCEKGLTCVMDWFQECNSHRWAAYFSKPDNGMVQERHKKLVDQLNELQAALEEFRSIRRKKVVQPYERFFHPQTKRLLKNSDEKEMFASRYFKRLISWSLAESIDQVAIHLLCLPWYLGRIRGSSHSSPQYGRGYWYPQA